MEKLVSSLDEYNAIFPHQLMTMELNEVKEQEEVISGEIYSLSERLREIKVEIELLDVQMACVLDQRDRAFERIRNLRLQRDKRVRFLPLPYVQLFFFLYQLDLKDLVLIECVSFCRMLPFSRIVLS